MKPTARILALVATFCALTATSVTTAAAQAAPPFVRVSPRDARYFETEDGKPFIPIGLNLIGPPAAKGDDADQRLAGLDRWLAKLEANGGNFIRAWLSNGFYELERQRAGEYDPAQAAHIDAMLALARKHHVRVKMTVEHFREIDPKGAKQPWAAKAIHLPANGGFAADMGAWVRSPEARRQFVGKLEFLAARYRDDSTVYGWELWNEMNAIRGGDYMGWTAYMLPHLHRLFPRQLCMQSLGSFDEDAVRPTYRKMATMSGNDVAQVHRYLDLGAKLDVCHGPVDVLAAEAVRELRAANPGRPIMLAESGAVEPSHSGPFKLYAKDTSGIILHDVLFAPFFAGAAGSGQCWHWENYVDRNDLWWQFSRFAAAVKDLDPPAERFEPVMVEHPDLRVYVLRGRHTLLAWCRDKSNDWRSELADGTPPRQLSGVRLDLGQRPTGAAAAPGPGTARIYDPWSDRWTTVALRADGTLELPKFQRSIVIRLGTLGAN